MRVSSIAARLAIAFAVASAAVSTLAGGALYLFECAELDRHVRQEILGRFVIVERMVQSNRDATQWSALTAKLKDFTPADGTLRFLFDGASPPYRFGDDFLGAARMNGPSEGFGTAEYEGQQFTTLAKWLPAAGERPAVRFIIAYAATNTRASQAMLAAGIVVVSLVAVLTIGALGWWIARRGLAPVDHLSDHARRLGEGDMTRRLPARDLPCELAGLVLAFNAALDRLQRSYVQLSTFNSDVAHELRTPLGNLIGETEVALTRPRSSEDLAAVLRSNLEELARLRSIVNDMLFLARADQGDVAANLVEASLAEECRRTADFMEVLFDEAGMTLRIEGEARARIERSLFGRALTNLLDNAVRHGKPGTVSVILEEREHDAVVTVRSPGQAIEENKLSRIFDRFYRADASRTDSADSHGLGLAIVSAVAQMHGGTVFARTGHEVNEIGLTLSRRTLHAKQREVPEGRTPHLSTLDPVPRTE